ncbi:unnamed protein product [Arctogadus glacialis]
MPAVSCSLKGPTIFTLRCSTAFLEDNGDFFTAAAPVTAEPNMEFEDYTAYSNLSDEELLVSHRKKSH